MIKILVEGDGDARSLPMLFGDDREASKKFMAIDMKGKANITRINGFERTLLRQKELGYKRFAVLLDADVFYYPYSSLDNERGGMQERASRIMASEDISVDCFWAIKAFESWIVGGLKRGNKFCGLNKTLSRLPENTETYPSHPKEWLKGHLKDSHYDPLVQACLTAKIDVSQAQRKNRSLKTFMESL